MKRPAARDWLVGRLLLTVLLAMVVSWANLSASAADAGTHLGADGSPVLVTGYDLQVSLETEPRWVADGRSPPATTPDVVVSVERAFLMGSGVAANSAAHAYPIGPASEKVTTVLNRVDAKGSSLAGFKGGKEFQNSQGRLPTAPGVSYREWDVNPHVKGVDRGPERLVTGSDGSAYFTSDHYENFMLVRGAIG